MSSELVTIETRLRSTAETKAAFTGSLEVSVSSDTAEEDPSILLVFRHWHPFMDASVMVPPDFARKLGEMLIEHTERVTKEK